MRLTLGLLAFITIIVGVQAAQLPEASLRMARPQGDIVSWAGWTVPLNISRSPVSPPQTIWPTMGVDASGQRIYLAWSERRPTGKDIYYAKSSDGGYAWTNATAAATTGLDSLHPSLAMSGTVAVVAWADMHIDEESYTTYQMTLGAGSPIEVPSAYTRRAFAPDLAWGAGGELHLARQGVPDTAPLWEAKATDILHSRRPAGAAAWSTETRVFENKNLWSIEPAIAVSADGQTLHMVWQETLGTTAGKVYYKRGVRSGDGTTFTWAPEPFLSLSEGITLSLRPAVAIGAGAVHVVWGEVVGGLLNPYQYVRYSSCDENTDCTQETNWSAPVRVDSEWVYLNNVSPTYINPDVEVTPSDAVCVTWDGFHQGAPHDAEEIYLSCSKDGGATWGSPLNVSTSPAVMSTRPTLAIGDDGILHLAWQELAGSDPENEYEIFYAHSLPKVVLLPVIRREQ